MAAERVDAEESAEQRTSSAGEWEPIGLPALPDSAAPHVLAHQGAGPWGAETESTRVQARFELGSAHAAKTFARELEADGYDVHEAESFVFIYADDAEHAHRLGEELKRRAPAGAQLFYMEEGSKTIFI